MLNVSPFVRCQETEPSADTGDIDVMDAADLMRYYEPREQTAIGASLKRVPETSSSSMDSPERKTNRMSAVLQPRHAKFDEPPASSPYFCFLRIN